LALTPGRARLVAGTPPHHQGPRRQRAEVHANHVGVITHADHVGVITHADHVGVITHAFVSANIHLSALSYVLCTAFLPPPASLNRPPRLLRPVRPLRQVRPRRPVRPVPPAQPARPWSTRAGGARPD